MVTAERAPLTVLCGPHPRDSPAPKSGLEGLLLRVPGELARVARGRPKPRIELPGWGARPAVRHHGVHAPTPGVPRDPHGQRRQGRLLLLRGRRPLPQRPRPDEVTRQLGAGAWLLRWVYVPLAVFFSQRQHQQRGPACWSVHAVLHGAETEERASPGEEGGEGRARGGGGGGGIGGGGRGAACIPGSDGGGGGGARGARGDTGVRMR